MSKPPPMGHNGFTFETRADIPPDVPKLFFVKVSIQDILDDILRIPADERGLYASALFVMYKSMEMLPADDKRAAMSVGMDVRQYRSLKAKLIARGLIYERPSGRVSNKRFEAEICAYVTEFKNRQEAAIERERKRKEARVAHEIVETSPRDPGHFSDTSRTLLGEVSEISRTSPGELGRDCSKKTNEINEATSTTEPQPEHKVGAVTSYKLLATSYKLDSSLLSTPQSAGADGELPVPFTVHPDGSFSGSAFEHFTSADVTTLRSIYSSLEFPAELVAADRYLDTEFSRDGTPFGSRERINRLHAYLAKRNREAAALAQAAQEAARSKARVEVDDSCWFEEDRLMVANGFKAELLALVEGSEARLRTTLDKAAGSVPIELKGTALRKTVRSQFTRFAEWGSQDERKTTAVERRTGGRAVSASGKPQETDAERFERMAREFDSEKQQRGA